MDYSRCCYCKYKSSINPNLCYQFSKRSNLHYDDAEIPVLFVAGQDQYDMAVEIGKTSNFLKLIVALKNDILIKDTSNSVYLQDFIGSEFDKSIDIKLNQAYSEFKVSDLASIIYTSGNYRRTQRSHVKPC